MLLTGQVKQRLRTDSMDLAMLGSKGLMSVDSKETGGKHWTQGVTDNVEGSRCRGGCRLKREFSLVSQGTVSLISSAVPAT